MKSLLLTIIFSVLLISCGEGVKRLDPFRWESVETGFDAATLELEQAFQDYIPIDSLWGKVGRLKRLSEGCDSGDVRRVRCCYWDARVLWRAGYRDSALMMVEETMPLIDSVRYTYDFFRFRSLLRQMSKTKGVRSYHEIDEELRFYNSVGDAPMTAAIYINFATNLYPIGELDKSLDYMHKADEINRALGYYKVVAKNAINVANIQFRRGNVEEGKAMLLELLKNPDITGDANAYNLVLRNLYAYTNDVEWLLKAYRTVEDDDDYRDLQGVYEAFISSHYEEVGKSDSAVVYSRRAMGNICFINDYGYKGLVMSAYSATMEREGKIDSALYYQKQYVLYSDSDYVQNQQSEVLRLVNVREVSLAMARENERVQRVRLYFVAALFALLLLGGVIYFMLYRKQKRHQLAVRDSRLAMEKSRRQLLAVMLAMEDKNNMLDALREEIEGMRKEGIIGAQEAGRLENLIKLHLAGGEEWDTFQQLFVEVNPDFVSRLHAAYPTLSDSYVRLATYIYMGLDNNKIARLLMIRPESVKQARWRLRRMMGLDKDTPLDDAIRALGDVKAG